MKFIQIHIDNLNILAMNTIKFTHHSIIALLFMSSFVLSCKKIDTSVAGSNNPIKTEKGTPAGDMSTTSIGTSGGTISSTDGNLTVTIPAGALSTTTTVSIQPITNNAPLGVGLGYRLMPEGTTFSQPVTLTFNYTQGLLGDSKEEFLWIVTQASDGSWNAMLKSVLDTINKTVTVQSTHFSDWSLGKFIDLTLNPTSKSLKKGKSVTLTVSGFVSSNTDEELQPLTVFNGHGTPASPTESRLVDFKVTQWTMNGVAAPVSNNNGSLSPSSNSATYTAPNNIPKTNPVAVSVQLATSDKYGKQKKYLLVSNITVVDDGYINLTIDNQSYTYNQYFINGNYPTDLTNYSNIICTYSAKHLSITSTYYQGTTMQNVFELNLNNPAVGPKVLVQTEDILFSLTPDKVTYSFSYVTYKPDGTGGCAANQTIGAATVTILAIDPITPTGTNLGNYQISGTFSGTIYDNPTECNAAKPHTINGDFSFEATK